MRYFTCEVENLRRGEWVAFIEETCYTVTATSRKKMEAAVRAHIEESQGEHLFEVIWLG